MPKVTKTIYPYLIHSTRAEAGYCLDAGSGMTGTSNVYDGNFEGKYANITFILDDIKYIQDGKVHVEITNSRAGMNSNYCTSYSPIAFINYKGYNSTTNVYDDFVEWTFNADRIQAMKQYIGTNNDITFSCRAGITSYNMKNNTSNWAYVGEVVYDLDTEKENGIYIEYSVLAPEITNLAVTGNSLDAPITVSWTQADVDSWTLQAILNGTVIKQWTGTTATSVEIPTGTLTSIGTYTFKLIAKSGTTVEATTTATLTRVDPIIIALEPNGVNQDKDTDITVSWNSTNQQRYGLIIDEGAKHIEYHGDIATSIVIPKGTFTRLDTVNMTLYTSYTSSWGEIRYASKSASFLLIGKPNTPVLETRQYYDNATPTFNWTCADEYVQYHLEVLKESTVVFNSGDVVSNSTSCQCTTVLENSTQYTVRVKVKTQFGYWSEYGTNVFTTNFSLANTPNIQAFQTGNGILINSNTTYSANFASCELYRKTDLTDWVRIGLGFSNVFSYTDNFVGSETYYYKVMSVSNNGGKNESEVVSINAIIKNFSFTNVEDIENGVELMGNPSISITETRETSTNLYSGCYAPVVEIGAHNYKRGSASFTVRKVAYDRLMKVINNAKVLLYRDRRGEKFYCCINSDISKRYDRGDIYNISFSFVEVPFLEKDMYIADGTPQNIVFFDGTYMFDGTITFSGEV